MHSREEKLEAFGRFLDVLDTLREKCPWDKKQTNESLRPNTIEETFELCDALMKDDKKNICKELGDVLLHVCFYAKIASETGDFDIADVRQVDGQTDFPPPACVRRSTGRHGRSGKPELGTNQIEGERR